MTQKLCLYLLMIIITCTLITGCTSDITTPKTTINTTTHTTTLPITTTPMDTTTPSTTIEPPTTTTPSWEWLTKTATTTITELVDIQKEQIRKAVLDLVVPEFKPVGDPIPILLTITNSEDSKWTSDIPITFINQDDEDQVVTWMINVSLDEKETQQVFVEGIQMGEGRWNVKVGFKTRVIFTS